jgi:hypothetical protein
LEGFVPFTFRILDEHRKKLRLDAQFPDVAKDSLHGIRDAVAGKGGGIPRALAITLLSQSDFPNRHRDLGALLLNENEPVDLRVIAAGYLGRMCSSAIEEILIGAFKLCLPEIRSSPRVEGILPNELQRSMGLRTLLESGEPNSL